MDSIVRPLAPLTRIAVAVFSIVLTVPALAQDESPDINFGEVVDVQLVNVEAWVTDGQGNPVLGLGKDDFEMLEDGKPVDITYFSEIGAEALRVIATDPPEPTAPPRFTEEPPAPPATASPAYLVLYFDDLHLTKTSRERLIKDVRPFLDSGVVDPERVLILRQKQDLTTEADFGSDRVALEQALRRVTEGGSGGTLTEQEKRLAVGRLQMTWEDIRNLNTLGNDPCDLFIPRSKVDVESYARFAANRILTTLENLNNVAAFLGGVPGVKTLIYVSDTLEMTPGRDILRVVESLCPGRAEIQTDFNLPDAMNMAFLNMTRSANANRVTFYAIQPSGLRTDFLTTAESRAGDFRTRSSIVSGAMRESDQSGMSFVSTETGGRAIFNTNTFDDALLRIGQEMTSYYSLAYTPPHGGDQGDHRIKVRIKGGQGMKVRHRLRYRDKSAEERVNDRLYSSLFLGLSDNPLDARLGAGSMKSVGKKKVAIPLHIAVPAEKLTFMPQEDGSVAGITIEVAAKDPEKAKVFKSRTSYRIPEPEEQEDSLISMVMKLELEEGKWLLAVAVRDEATLETSYVSTSFEVIEPPESASTGP